MPKRFENHLNVSQIIATIPAVRAASLLTPQVAARIGFAAAALLALLVHDVWFY
jgi:hypothetical protein